MTTTKKKAVAPNVAHFAVHVDDIPRACRFYEKVFGWRFEAWGPPGFFLIATGTKEDPGIRGSLHQRHVPLTGDGIYGFECTVSVADVVKTSKDVVAAGGKMLMQKMTISTVGHLIQFHDTEGNLVNAMEYDADAK